MVPFVMVICAYYLFIYKEAKSDFDPIVARASLVRVCSDQRTLVGHDPITDKYLFERIERDGSSRYGWLTVAPEKFCG